MRKQNNNALCVLIPAYNEANTIGLLVDELKTKRLKTYVVDDGSDDKTALIAKKNGAIVIRNRNNQGKGASLRMGFQRILKDGFDAVLTMDADGQHKVSDIDNFRHKMNEAEADLIIGNRMNDTKQMPYIRMLTNYFMSGMLSHFAGSSIPDTQCGFRLIKKEVLLKVNLEFKRYEIESELILQAAKYDFRIASVPIQTVYQGEVSKINPLVDTLRFINMLVGFLRKNSNNLKSTALIKS